MSMNDNNYLEKSKNETDFEEEDNIEAYLSERSTTTEIYFNYFQIKFYTYSIFY